MVTKIALITVQAVCGFHVSADVVPLRARKTRLSPTVAARLKPMKHEAVIASAVGKILHTHARAQHITSVNRIICMC